MSNSPAVKKSAPPIRPLPEDVLRLLREQAKSHSQTSLAEQLNVSNSAVNQAIHDKYRGNVDRFSARVRGLWGGDSVHCPILGSINTKVCLDQQSKGAVYSNPMRVALARACKKCPNRQQQNGGSDHE